MNQREGVKVISHSPDGSPVLVEASVAGIGFNRSKGAVIEITLVREPLHLVLVIAYTFGQGKMPFAAHAGMIAGIFQCFRDSNTISSQTLPHAGNANGLRIASCQQLGT